jgi:predicted PurR-regulated permease PerM
VAKTNAENQTNSIAAQDNQQIHKQIISSAKDWIGQVMPKVGNWLLNLLTKVTSLVDVVVAIILIPIYTYYFLHEKREIKSHWTNYLPIRDSRVKDELVYILSAINQYMVAFFRGQVLVALISGALYTIGYLALGLDYAFLLGVTAVVLIIIPFVGAIINGIIALILTAIQFQDLFHPLMIVVIFAIVQSLESFFYSPRIMGNRVNLHPVVVIIALMIGMTLMGGLLGGILAIPLAAALRVLLFRYVWKKPEPPGPKI